MKVCVVSNEGMVLGVYSERDKDYGKRWLCEQTNSVLELVYNLSASRMRGIRHTIVHAFSCLVANFIDHFMD